MIDIEKFVLKGEVESNPLVKIHLKAMKWFGYMIFEHQRIKRLHCFRGVVFTFSFIVFNLTQVRFGIYKFQGEDVFDNFHTLSKHFFISHPLKLPHVVISICVRNNFFFLSHSYAPCSLSLTTVCGFVSKFP